MNTKLLLGFLAFLAIGFSFGGFGQFFGLNQTLVEKHLEFMQAMHSGDFEKAKNLAAQYHFGPDWLADEQIYSIKTQLYQAYLNNDTTKVQQLRQQLFELKQKNFQSKLNLNQNANQFGFKKSDFSSFKNKNRFFANCPFALNSTNQQ
jgi:dihydrodipicolinate synthase/N-acetylneuraminate lyase